MVYVLCTMYCVLYNIYDRRYILYGILYTIYEILFNIFAPTLHLCVHLRLRRTLCSAEKDARKRLSKFRKICNFFRGRKISCFARLFEFDLCCAARRRPQYMPLHPWERVWSACSGRPTRAEAGLGPQEKISLIFPLSSAISRVTPPVRILGSRGAFSWCS